MAHYVFDWYNVGRGIDPVEVVSRREQLVRVDVSQHVLEERMFWSAVVLSYRKHVAPLNPVPKLPAPWIQSAVQAKLMLIVAQTQFQHGIGTQLLQPSKELLPSEVELLIRRVAETED